MAMDIHQTSAQRFRKSESIVEMRRQSAAATALSCAPHVHEFSTASRTGESGVALRFPPQSKIAGG
jgi:hypothetical protein